MSRTQFEDKASGTLLESMEFVVDDPQNRPVETGVNQFSPIAIGKPMTIKLMTVYAGDYKNGLFKGKKDMIVTSRMKAINISDVAPRAVHQVYVNMAEKVAVAPGAGNYGTPLIYCTPSFVDEGMMVNLEMKIDNFKQDQMEAVGKILNTLGSIPIFAEASGILVAGGSLVKAAAPLVNSLAEKKNWLSYDFDTVIRDAGRKSLKEGFHLIRNSSDSDTFASYEITLNDSNRPELRHKVKKTYYRGEKPYAIISINGEISDDHVGFTPALASAAVLQKFFGVRESGSLDEDVKNLLEISNDYYFNKKIVNLRSKLKGLSKDSAEFKAISEKIDAYEKNLQTEIFKKKQ